MQGHSCSQINPRHQNKLTAGILFFLTKPQLCQLPSQKFLDELASAAVSEHEILQLVMDTLCMNRRLDEPVRITCFKDSGHVKEIHNKLTALYNEFAQSRAENAAVKFPPPPLPGTREIEPITKAKELLKEGIDQRHCAASYDKRVSSGNVYLYRILHPERATLSIRREGIIWTIDQLKGFANKSVLPETVKHVQRWLVAEQAKSFSTRALPLME